jgi:hypothetical protein
MAAELTRLAHKIAIQLHLVAESCTICSSRSRRPVRKLLDTSPYVGMMRVRYGTKLSLYLVHNAEFPLTKFVLMMW